MTGGECPAGPHEKRLRSTHRTAEQMCDLFDRELVDVSKREDQSVSRRQSAQQLNDALRALTIQIVELIVNCLMTSRPHERHPAILATRASIVIDELVTGDADHPRHRLQLRVTSALGSDH